MFLLVWFRFLELALDGGAYIHFEIQGAKGIELSQIRLEEFHQGNLLVL